MSKAQPILLSVLALVLMALVAMAVVQNWDAPISLYFWDRQIVDVPMGLLLFAVGVASAAASTLIAWNRMLALGYRQQRANRELERKDVSTEAAQNRVQILEGQVATLEEALKRALATQFPPS